MTTVPSTANSRSPASSSAGRRLRVMIVDDSRVIREFLTQVIARDPRLQVVAAVESGEQAMRVLTHVAPDVISMDICLPGWNGFETTRRIMAERPTPIVVVAADAGPTEPKASLDALRAGALSVLEKPAGNSLGDYEAFAERLCTQLAIMSQVRVVTQRNGFRPRAAPAAKPRTTSHQGNARPTDKHELVGIVASTGGPNALVEVLNGLGPEFPLPVLIVQHMTQSFSSAFVEWLDDVCAAPVREAQQGMRPEAGHVYVAPADRHLVLRPSRLGLEDGPLVCMQRPSGTVLFQSLAATLRSQAIGVLLTGMGEDGAEGLLALREAGGHTIAEDESTAVVYGMPGAAVALGAVGESLPLPRIAPRLNELVSS